MIERNEGSLNCFHTLTTNNSSLVHFTPLESRDSRVDDSCTESEPRCLSYRILSAVLAILLMLCISYRFLVVGDDYVFGVSWKVLIPVCFILGMYGSGTVLYCISQLHDRDAECTQSKRNLMGPMLATL